MMYVYKRIYYMTKNKGLRLKRYVKCDIPTDLRYYTKNPNRCFQGQYYHSIKGIR